MYSLKKFFKAFPEFINIKTNTEEVGIHGNEDLVQSAIYYLYKIILYLLMIKQNYK